MDGVAGLSGDTRVADPHAATRVYDSGHAFDHPGGERRVRVAGKERASICLIHSVVVPNIPFPCRK